MPISSGSQYGRATHLSPQQKSGSQGTVAKAVLGAVRAAATAAAARCSSNCIGQACFAHRKAQIKCKNIDRPKLVV